MHSSAPGLSSSDSCLDICMLHRKQYKNLGGLIRDPGAREQIANGYYIYTHVASMRIEKFINDRRRVAMVRRACMCGDLTDFINSGALSGVEAVRFTSKQRRDVAGNATTQHKFVLNVDILLVLSSCVFRKGSIRII